MRTFWISGVWVGFPAANHSPHQHLRGIPHHPSKDSPKNTQALRRGQPQIGPPSPRFEIVHALSLFSQVVYEPESLSLRVTDFDRSREQRFCFIENRHAWAGQLYVSPGLRLWADLGTSLGPFETKPSAIDRRGVRLEPSFDALRNEMISLLKYA